MGFSIAVQGILQSLGYAGKPLLISLLRLVVFVFPIAYLFTLSDNVADIVWWTFPIAEILTAFISIFILKKAYKERVEVIEAPALARNLVIAISHEHGTNGKEIARKVAERLGINFYDKEEIKKFAVEKVLVENKNDEETLYRDFLSLDANKEAKKYVNQLDKSRATYYEVISNQVWGDKSNYDICIDCQIGNDKVINSICDYVKNKNII